MTSIFTGKMIDGINTLLKAPVLFTAVLILGGVIGYLLAKMRYKGALTFYTDRVLFWKKSFQGADNRDFEKAKVDQQQLKKKLRQIDALINLGKNIKLNKNVMRNGSVQISDSMKELKNEALYLVGDFLGEEHPLYREALNHPDVKSGKDPKVLRSSKSEFVDHYVALLLVLKKTMKA